MQTTIEVQIPTPLLRLGLDQQAVQQRINEWLVLSLFTEEHISSGKAAHLLHISRIEFLALLRRRGIAYLNFNADELADELAAVDSLEISPHMIVVSSTTPLIGLALYSKNLPTPTTFWKIYIHKLFMMRLWPWVVNLVGQSGKFWPLSG